MIKDEMNVNHTDEARRLLSISEGPDFKVKDNVKG